MRLESVTAREFRCYERLDAALGPGLTVVTGPNGAGKTNLLEAVYFGCTGRSCRTANEREVIRFGAGATRVEIRACGPDGPHLLAVGFAPAQPKRMSVDGAPVERLVDSDHRPLVSVFLPDRLELVKGAPALRRAHLDQVIAALWPARTASRRAYAQALAQRNALLARVRSGATNRDALAAWDLQLARHGIALMADRSAAVEQVAAPFTARAASLGLDGRAALAYRPRSKAEDAAGLTAELAAHLETDLERGFTGHGPHRDDLVVTLGGRDLRAYGSQGQQRLSLLSLLLAERDAIAATRDAPPLMLLDDVMSELDRRRRAALVELLRDGGGQSVITTTDLEHVPGGAEPTVTRIAVASATIVQAAAAA